MGAVKSYPNPAATIVVTREGWNSTVIAVTTRSSRRPVTFLFDRSGYRAAAWLAGHDLTGKVWAGQTWSELEEAVAAPQPVVAPVVTPAVVQVPKATTEEVAALVERLVTQRLEEVLELHYAEVLGSPTGRAMWRKLLRDHSTLEKAAKVTKEAGR